MHTSAFRLGLIFAVMSFAAIAVPAQAQQQIVIGTRQGQNAFPFGYQLFPPDAYAAGGEYQQIYSGADFQSAVSGPFYITSIGFSSSASSRATIALYDVTLSLSSTQVNLSGPSTAFQDNEGPDFTPVFSGTYTAFLTHDNTFDLIFPTSPFRYDPARSNLLLDVVINNATIADDFAFFNTNGPNQTGRVFQAYGTGPSFAKGAGLYTQFGITPVPEASTAAGFAVLLSLGGLTVAVRRRRASR